MNHFDTLDISVSDEFIDKFARLYISQRTELFFSIEELAKMGAFDCDFNVGDIMNVIKQYSVVSKRGSGGNSSTLNDVIRSDMGELLTTYYFEEELDKSRSFTIPLKNISYRERADMPGRGFDAIGYRLENDKIHVLMAEAKVSEEKNNPPAVVDKNKDSLYKSHKAHHDNIDVVYQQLTDYTRRLSARHASVFTRLFLHMAHGETDKYNFTYGCGLTRDYTCVDTDRDFGKMKSLSHEFEPGEIDFAIFVFKEKTISETIDLFYEKTRKLINE